MKMSYCNMDEEVKKHLDFIKKNESTFSKLTSFFKELGKNGVKFIEKVQKSFDEFITELKKEDNTTTTNIALTNICNDFNTYLTKKRESYASIEKKLGEKVSEYERKYRNEYRDNITKMSRLSIQINDAKAQVDKIKNDYFNSCKETLELEKKMDVKKNDEELLKLTEKRLKLKESSEDKKGAYSKEVRNFNKLLDDKEIEYSGIKACFKNEQNDKMIFYTEVINLINTICKSQSDELISTLKKINKAKEEINMRRDLKLYEQDFNFSNNATKKRFVEEQFLNYELRKRSNSKSEKSTDEENIEDPDSKYMRALQIVDLGKDEFIDSSTLNENDIKLDALITQLIESEAKVEEDVYKSLVDFYKINFSNTKRFMYLLVNHFCVKKCIQMNSLDNYNNLNNILSEILTMNLEKKENNELVFFIMFIANKTVYYNSSTNNIEKYLCNDLSSKNKKVFLNLNFWTDLLKERIELIAEVEITQEMQKRKDSIAKDTNNPMNNFVNIFKKGKLGNFGKFLGIGGNNQDLEQEILFNQSFQKKSATICYKVLEDYLKQFINYNFYGKSVLKLIDTFGNNYKLPIQYKAYFKKVLETNQKIKRIFKYQKLKREENYDKYIFSFKVNKNLDDIKDIKIIGLIFSLRYLDIKEFPNLLCLNKSIKSILEKNIYKNILIFYSHKLNIQQHITLWKNLLGFNDIKKKYDYKKILEEIKQAPNKVKNIDIIDLDVIRTSFDVDEEINRNKISNMLKAISKELPSLNYCQGMNQIASFLLDICDYNEEEAFFIFLSLMLGSVYPSLFINELEKLNIIFYQFERLLSHYLPEVYFYLIENKITPGFFASPWFITIFTDTFIDKKEINNKEIVMRIFDLFIFEGWEAIIKVGINLLKFNEIKILKTPMEELLNFLTNDVIKSDYFGKNNLNCAIEAELEICYENNIIEEINEQNKLKKSLPSLD